MKRRNFIQTSSTVASSLLITTSQIAFGSKANSKPRVGFVGCGGRGTFVANIFKKNEGFELTAAADYFPDKLEEFGAAFSIPKEAQFSGLDGYKAMLAADKIDVLAVHSPPWFHPEQTAAAIEAGKHVFLAKPIAVDVPGTLLYEELAQKAAAKKLVIAVDFQTRGNDGFREAARRVKEGALGDFCYGRCRYEAGTLRAQAPNDGAPEHVLRNWVFDQALSGDIITEQNIHALDVLSWMMGQPLIAIGSRGRKVRTDVGNTSDHYSVLYRFPQGDVTFSSRQYDAWGAAGANTNELFGSNAAVFTEFGGPVLIRGPKEIFWNGGKTPDLYESGSVNNVKEFLAAIQASDATNGTIAPSIQSNLITILGRTAAELERPVTWDEMIKDTRKIEFDLTGLKKA